MKKIIQQLRAARDYAGEQKNNTGLNFDNRQRYADDEAFLENAIQSILNHFGAPDEDDQWFWRGDYDQ